MTIKGMTIACLASILCLGACTEADKTNSFATIKDTLTNVKTHNMKSYISMFEIPATDITRAIDFYQTLLDREIERMDVEGMQMGILPYEGQMVTGVIIKADGYMPSADGVTIYLDAGDNLQVMLDRVEKKGGEIIMPKTAHADESGYFAIFLDSEGNRMAVSSPN